MPNLTSPTQIQKILEEIGERPKKHFGQNFLINKGVVEKIIKASELNSNDTILEVGPGIGVLTFEIAPKVEKLLAVEKDKNIAENLKTRLKEAKIENVQIIEQDILKFKPKNYKLKANKPCLPAGKYKLVANIPYYLTSALIKKFLEEETKPKEIILMIQKEVAQRICQKEKSSILSLSVQFYADAEILFHVSKNSFWPAPKVDSAVIKIIPKSTPIGNPEPFFKLIKAGFSSPRKQLISNLSKNLKIDKEALGDIFTKLNINQKSRAENLKLQNWLSLGDSISK